MKSLILSVTLITFFFASCKKNDNKLSGFISYKGAITGIEYKANGATVEFYIDSDLDFKAYSTVTDSEGYYSIYPMDYGDYYMYSTITVGGIKYEKTQIISISKKSISERNMLLE